MVISMDFLLKRGQKCLIRISEKETDAVKIAVSNLRTDLEKAVGVSAEIVALGAHAEEAEGNVRQVTVWSPTFLI